MMDGLMDGLKRWTDGWMDDGQIGEWMDGWMEKMNRWMDR